MAAVRAHRRLSRRPVRRRALHRDVRGLRHGAGRRRQADGGRPRGSFRCDPRARSRSPSFRTMPAASRRTRSSARSPAAPAGPCSRSPAGCRCNARSIVAANLFLLALALAIATRRNLYVGLQSAGQALLGGVLPMVRPLVRADSPRRARRAGHGLGSRAVRAHLRRAADRALRRQCGGRGGRHGRLRPRDAAESARGRLDRGARPRHSSTRPSRGSRRRRSSAGFAVAGLWRAALPGALAAGAFCL